VVGSKRRDRSAQRRPQEAGIAPQVLPGVTVKPSRRPGVVANVARARRDLGRHCPARVCQRQDHRRRLERIGRQPAGVQRRKEVTPSAVSSKPRDPSFPRKRMALRQVCGAELRRKDLGRRIPMEYGF
jgi:hypothetical protein